MKLFSKIDKEILIVLLSLVIALLLVSFIIFKYISSPGTKIENSAGGIQTEQNN